MGTLMERARELQARGIFLGGPLELFETGGRKMLITLLGHGLTPGSKVLDIGCGCLRGGYWLIHFLDEACYFGIEPNKTVLEAGVEILLEPGLADRKKPRFDHNADFDLGVFNERFDFLVARSIWTHASKQQIQRMLDGFVAARSESGVLLASYKRPTSVKADYTGTQWVGKSHASGTPGVVHHSLGWIQAECASRGLAAEEVPGREYNFGDQTWLRVRS